MLLKRYANGKVKPKDLQEIHCPACNDGKDFEVEEHIRTREFGWKNDEIICGTCESKYIAPRKPARFITGNYCNACPYLDGTTCTQQANTFLCTGRVPSLLRAYKKLNEGLEMNEGLLKQREVFLMTQKCPEHYWIKSQPFTTPEGTFEIENCLVCGLAKFNYKGTNYEDNMMKILSFLATKGMEKLKVEKEKIVKQDIIFKDIGLDKVQQTPDIQLTGLFDIIPTAPKIEFTL